MDTFNLIQKNSRGLREINDLNAALNGIRNELVSIFSNEEITLANSLARDLEECEPMSDHVSNLSLLMMHKAIKRPVYKLAKNTITSGAKEGAKRIYIELLINEVVMHVVSVETY